jgi:hypothetical protein
LSGWQALDELLVRSPQVVNGGGELAVVSTLVLALGEVGVQPSAEAWRAFVERAEGEGRPDLIGLCAARLAGTSERDASLYHNV